MLEFGTGKDKKSGGKGVITKKVRCVRVVDISGEQLPYMTRPCELGIAVTMEIGKTFQPVLNITGEFKRDPQSQEITGWGSAFKIRDFFEKFGLKGALTPDNRILPETLEQVVGLEFLLLSYVTGKKNDGQTKWGDWSEIAPADSDPALLIAHFMRQVAKGYPSNFRPDQDGPGDATFNPAELEKAQ